MNEQDIELNEAANECANSGGPFSIHRQNYKYMFMEGARWQSEKENRNNNVTIGVGDGDGNMFVHGSYEAVKILQDKLIELEQLRNKQITESKDPSEIWIEVIEECRKSKSRWILFGLIHKYVIKRRETTK